METSKIRKRMPVDDPARSRRSCFPRSGRPSCKLDPRTLAKNPVMFVLEMVTLLTHGPARARRHRARGNVRL